jgi:uroporphyrinogen decarboxylase
MNHKERMEECVNGGKVDRPPVILWRHFPVADQDPFDHAKATMDFQHRFDFDLIKVSPSSSYCLVDWNVVDQWQGHPEGTREYLHYPIASPEDWHKLKPLDPNSGFLGKTIEALLQVKKHNDTGAPVVQTIFSPLSQAKNLAGKDVLAIHMRKFPDALKAGLETISSSIQNYLEVLRSIKMDGIFYAVQHAQYALLSLEEFDNFNRSYDLGLLNSMSDFPYRLLHIHGSDIMFDQVNDYPVNLINWHDRESEYSLVKGKLLTRAAVCGGISRETISTGSPDQVMSEVIRTWEESDKLKTSIGTGCVIPVITPEVNIYAARKAAESLVL